MYRDAQVSAPVKSNNAAKNVATADIANYVKASQGSGGGALFQ